MCVQNHCNSGTKEIATGAPKNLEEICLQQNYDTLPAFFEIGVAPAQQYSQGTIFRQHNISFLANVHSRSRSLYAIAHPSVCCL